MKLLSTTAQTPNEWAPWVKTGDRVFYLLSNYSEKDVPKSAGWAFAKETKKLWFTTDYDKACRLADYADGDLHKELSAQKIALATNEEKSRKESSDIALVHPENLDYKPFQYAGIDFMIGVFYERGEEGKNVGVPSFREDTRSEEKSNRDNKGTISNGGVERKGFRENERENGDSERQTQKSDTGLCEKERGEFQGGEWSRFDSSGYLRYGDSDSNGVQKGISNKDEESQNESSKSCNNIQSRFCESKRNDSNRTGWTNPHQIEDKNGSKKDRCSYELGVEGNKNKTWEGGDKRPYRRSNKTGCLLGDDMG